MDTPVDTAVENPVDNSGDTWSPFVDPNGCSPDSFRWVAPLHGDSGLRRSASFHVNQCPAIHVGVDTAKGCAILRVIKRIWFSMSAVRWSHIAVAVGRQVLFHASLKDAIRRR